MAKPKKWRTPAAKVVDSLVTENIRLAHAMALKYENTGYWEPAEALSLAMDGLLIAAKRWNKKFGVPFGTYAGMRINWRFNNERKRRSLKKHGGHATFINLDEPLGVEGDSATVSTSVSIDEMVIAVLARIERFPAVTREAVKMRFGLNGYDAMTLCEIGRRQGITHEGVRLRVKDALKTMRGELRESEIINDLKVA
jgi:RNA polymerase sigma factor (sigma-70 family)